MPWEFLGMQYIQKIELLTGLALGLQPQAIKYTAGSKFPVWASGFRVWGFASFGDLGDRRALTGR